MNIIFALLLQLNGCQMVHMVPFFLQQIYILSLCIRFGNKAHHVALIV